MPAGTSLKAYVGAEMARQNVQMYVYKNDELTPVSGLLAVDASGWVTVENYDGGDLVFVRTDVGSYTVAVIVGEHGSVTPNGNITAVMGESVSLNATADEGYIIESIKVDGVEMDLEKGQREYSYTLTGKRQPHGGIFLCGRPGTERLVQHRAYNTHSCNSACACRRRRAVLSQMASIQILNEVI